MERERGREGFMKKYRRKMKVGRKLKLNKLSQRKTFLWSHSGFLLTFSYVSMNNDYKLV